MDKRPIEHTMSATHFSTADDMQTPEDELDRSRPLWEPREDFDGITHCGNGRLVTRRIVEQAVQLAKDIANLPPEQQDKIKSSLQPLRTKIFKAYQMVTLGEFSDDEQF